MAAAKTVEEVLRSDPFYSPDTNLDLSGHPAFHSATIPPAKPDPFEPRDSGVGRNDLRKFIENETAEKTPATVVHVLDEPFAVFYDKGTWRATGKLAGMKHALTGKSRDEVLNKLIHLSQRVEAEAIHDLTPSQEIEIARLCQSGNRGEGIARYLEYRIGERAEQYGNGSEMVSDPELQNVMAECAYFCWLNSRADVRDSEEFRTFLSDYAGSRPINFDLLDAGWTAFLPHQDKQSREAAVARFAKPEELSAKEVQAKLEDMSDEEIKKQYWSTAKAIARAAR